MTGSAITGASSAHPTLDEAAKKLRAARASVDTFTRSYQDIRRGSREAGIARARVQWGLALSVWVDALIVQEEARDREHIERRRRAQEQAMHAAPGDPFAEEERSFAEEERSPAGEVTRRSEERERRAAVERDRHRYDRCPSRVRADMRPRSFSDDRA